MPLDKSIFGLRFGSNEKLLPSQEDLRVFLARAHAAGTREPHVDELAPYGKLLEDVQAFEKNQLPDAEGPDFRKKMYYGVLGRSSFVKHALKSAVEEYKFHLHALLSLDFRKPESFIRAAKEEMSSLSLKKKGDAAKLARLKGMVEERQRTIETLGKCRKILAGELGDIAQYIRDNLIKIEKLCEASIVVLVEVQLRQKKENQLIEDIKTQLKDRLRDSLHQGSISRQHLESVKVDVNLLLKEISARIREDVYAMTGLFEAIHGHAKKIAREIDALLAQTGGTGNKGFEEEAGLFSRIERALVLLVSEYRFELKTAEISTQTAYEDIFLEKRREMLDHVLELLQKERRARSDRRSGEDRRRFDDPGFKGPERRAEKNRRSGKNRRDR
jgi:hypothetical protein